MPEIKNLVKEESLYVTCGVYLDWQERIYGILPPLDLTDVPDNTETTFREFNGVDYEEEAFIDMDLSHCRFIGCKFIGSIFTRIAFGVFLGGWSPAVDDFLGCVQVVLSVVGGHHYEGGAVAVGHFAELSEFRVGAVAFFSHEGNLAFADVQRVVVAESTGD